MIVRVKSKSALMNLLKTKKEFLFHKKVPVCFIKKSMIRVIAGMEFEAERIVYDSLNPYHYVLSNGTKVHADWIREITSDIDPEHLEFDKKMSLNNSASAYLVELRAKSDLTQDQVAKLYGINRASYAGYEARSAIPSTAVFIYLVKKLGGSLKEFERKIEGIV
jgi:DNA-binding XRE family transcriptional regulator